MTDTTTLAPEAVHEPEAPAPSPVESAVEAEFPVYDFSRSSRVDGDQLRALSAMHDVLAEGLSAWMTAKLREPVRFELNEVEELTFTQIVRRLARPSCAYLYDIHGPGDLTALILLEPSVAFMVTDRLLGGTADPMVPQRALTELEQRVSRLAVERIREEVEEIWAEHIEFRTSFRTFESIPDLLDFAEPGEPFLVSDFTVEGKGWAGEARVHLPFALLESALQTKGADAGGDANHPSPDVERRLIEGHVLQARVTVDARLPAFTVSLGELQDLQPGTVLNTRIPTDAPVEVSVCGQTRLTATAGRKGQELAVRILGTTYGGFR